MSQHTPGPWKIEQDEVLSSAGVPLANVYGSYGRLNASDIEECLANARLIAAAPRMLALLNEYASKSQDVKVPVPGSLIERTRAILRDVEGESNG